MAPQTTAGKVHDHEQQDQTDGMDSDHLHPARCPRGGGSSTRPRCGVVDPDRYREICVGFTLGWVNLHDAITSLKTVLKGIPDLRAQIDWHKTS